MTKDVRKHFASTLVLVSCCLALQGNAAPILDQSFTEPRGASTFINEAFAFVAQTYTAQRDGSLAGVSVDIDSATGVRLRVSLRSVQGGLPTGEMLGETLLTTGSSGIDDIIGFRLPIAQRRGEQYAIAVDYPGEPRPAGLTHRWDGAPGNAYRDGTVATSLDGINWFFDDPQLDLHFRSFVRVSAPSSSVAFVTGLIVLCVGPLGGLGRLAKKP